MTEQDPNGLNQHAGGAKMDAGKEPVRTGFLEYFPRAILAVARISAFGANKYCWGGWKDVKDGKKRYGDAEARHILYAAIEGEKDADSKLDHAAHEAWNALARLEFILKEREDAKPTVIEQRCVDRLSVSFNEGVTKGTSAEAPKFKST